MTTVGQRVRVCRASVPSSTLLTLRAGRALAVTVAVLGFVVSSLHASQRLELRQGDRIAIVGNTYAERLQLHGYLESGILLGHPELRLSFRNLAWSGDEIALRPRPLNFGPLEEHLERVGADVVLLFYGANESFSGADGLDAFRVTLQRFVSGLAERRFHERDSGFEHVRLALFAPIPQEVFPGAPDPLERNRDLAAYRDAMSAVALELEIPFVDVYDSLANAMAVTPRPLTINGMHLGERGALINAEAILDELEWATLRSMGYIEADEVTLSASAEELRQSILRRNRLVFDRYRAVNGYYIYGDRKEPFGVINFPAEMTRFDELADVLDRKIQDAALRLRGGAR